MPIVILIGLYTDRAVRDVNLPLVADTASTMEQSAALMEPAVD